MATETYPTNAKELMTSEYANGDDFFLLARASRGPDGSVTLTVSENDPIAVNNKDLRQKIESEQSVHLPTRKEINTGKAGDVYKDYVLMGANLRLELEQGRLPLRIPTQYRKDKHLDILPGGVVSDADLRHTAEREVNEETAVVAKDGNTLKLLAFVPDNATEQDIAAARTLKEGQIKLVQARLAEKEGADFASYPMSVEVVRTSEIPAAKGAERVHVSILGHESDFAAHVAFNEAEHSITPVFGERAKLPKHYRLFTVDPQEYNNPATLKTVPELLAADGTLPLQEAKEGAYSVQPGDNPWKIAQKFGYTGEDIPAAIQQFRECGAVPAEGGVIHPGDEIPYQQCSLPPKQAAAATPKK